MAQTSAPAEAQDGLPDARTVQWLRWGLLVVTVILLAGGSLRMLPLTAPGRRMVEAAVTGIEVGRLGQLEVRGLRGDVWRDFSVDSLAIADPRGVWLRARGVHVRWRWPDIFARRLQIQSLAAAELDILRRPVLGAPEPSGRSPLSFAVDRVVIRVTTAPAFSMVRGDFDLTGRLFVDRRGSASGSLCLASRLHRRDFLQARFGRLARRRHFSSTRARRRRKAAPSLAPPGLPPIDPSCSPPSRPVAPVGAVSSSSPGRAKPRRRRRSGPGPGRVDRWLVELTWPIRACFRPCSR